MEVNGRYFCCLDSVAMIDGREEGKAHGYVTVTRIVILSPSQGKVSMRDMGVNMN